MFLVRNRDDLLEPVFKWKEVRCIKEHLQTLKPTQSVYYSVIDTWATMLNDTEKYKSDKSPLRLFCTIGDLIFSIDEKKRFPETFPSFCKGMDKILDTFSIEKIENTDMHSHFCNYLNDKVNASYSKRIRKLKPVYLTMPWQTLYNSSDCAVFLMRHMETFKGDPKNWNTELSVEGPHQHNQLMKMRVKFITAILTSHLNELKDNIIQEASGMFVKAAEMNLINLVKSATPAKQLQENSPGSGKKSVSFAEPLIASFHEVAEELSQSQEDEPEATENNVNEGQ
ncbi:hypothetical protein ACET3Z_028200 [Daucus carota]